MNTKHILKSRTFWVNAISLLVEVTGLLEQSGLKPGTALVVMNVLNIGLRVVTNTAVTPFLEGAANKEKDTNGTN